MSQFMKQIKFILEEVKVIIYKFQNNMSRYYNRYHMFAPVFNSENKIFLIINMVYTLLSKI